MTSTKATLEAAAELLRAYLPCGHDGDEETGQHDDNCNLCAFLGVLHQIDAELEALVRGAVPPPVRDWMDDVADNFEAWCKVKGVEQSSETFGQFCAAVVNDQRRGAVPPAPQEPGICGAVKQVTFTCTRSEGHTGPHIEISEDGSAEWGAASQGPAPARKEP